MKKSIARYNTSTNHRLEAYSTNSHSSNDNTNFMPTTNETIFSTIRNTIGKPRHNYAAISKSDELDVESNNQDINNPMIVKDDNRGKTIPGNWGKSISINDANDHSNDYGDRLSSNDINNEDININTNADSSSDNIKSTLYQNSNYFLPNKREFKFTIKQLLNDDDIDYDNRSYLLSRFRKDKQTDPIGFERSFNQSKLILSGLTNPNIFDFSQLNSQLISGSLFNSTSMMSASPSANEKSVGFSSPTRTSPTYVNHTSPINYTIHSRKKEINRDMTESV
eukprot:CAMPEP_0196768236 /NCGR_PEP_ID=MMETSP1095-20130614/42498_1 /TAXON_ID=96789 ORGANISM="Chromulina nebulosa, Strain UTEXLB2642" /NCGR_SAMPLE_ID=MMETSP1095 /ASSEMBLY_ACC=CAM_ASM_000446 /LENGTH=279 /DNA_ID=CAMNT_0042137517 /DNA_START=1004 /DNA_END=1843 /DNA_ORIENTATION=-